MSTIRAEVVVDTYTPAALNVEGRAAQRDAAMGDSLALIQGATIPQTPVFTGGLAGSWQAQVLNAGGTTVSGAVGSPLDYSAPVEVHRSAGSAAPPTDAIAGWVSEVLGPDVDPFVIARSIGRKGIPGREMLRRGAEATRSERAAIWDEVARRGLQAP